MSDIINDNNTCTVSNMFRKDTFTIRYIDFNQRYYIPIFDRNIQSRTDLLSDESILAEKTLSRFDLLDIEPDLISYDFFGCHLIIFMF